MQQTSTKRQQPLNTGRTNGRKLQLKREGYPIAISITCTILSSSYITHKAVLSHRYKNKTSSTFYLHLALHSNPPPRMFSLIMMSLSGQHRLYPQVVRPKHTTWRHHCPYSQQILNYPEISTNRVYLISELPPLRKIR
jgi:hypothetical protein